MKSSALPVVLQEYLNFCRIRNNAKQNGIIDLSPYKWFYPSSMLPLCNLLKYNGRSMMVISPYESVTNYISILMGTSYYTSTFIPITYLPKEKREVSDVITQLKKLHNNGIEYGGINAFNYLIGELIDNIYQHSEFTNASLMAQRYEKKGFTEISIFDDGISIPTCFENHGLYSTHDANAIQKAVNGLSTKDESRGYGLNTSIKLYVNGVAGSLLLVSRQGAFYLEHDRQNDEQLYNLSSQYGLDGTLITFRIPYPVKEVNIYDYI
jgi:anti-sigma regulatory factor (Ser/Thr protein kinase)